MSVGHTVTGLLILLFMIEQYIVHIIVFCKNKICFPMFFSLLISVGKFNSFCPLAPDILLYASNKLVKFDRPIGFHCLSTLWNWILNVIRLIPYTERLTGTKLGCAEGGCGACTVMVSRFNRRENSVLYPCLCSLRSCRTKLCFPHFTNQASDQSISKVIANIKQKSFCALCELNFYWRGTAGLMMLLL